MLFVPCFPCWRFFFCWNSRIINSIYREAMFFVGFGVTFGDNIFGIQNAGRLFATTKPAQGDAKTTVDGNSKES